MDIRYKYVNELVENIVVKIVFVKSADNDIYILIKNLSAELHEKHLKKLVGDELNDIPSFKNI